MAKAIGKSNMMIGSRNWALVVLSLWVLLTIASCGPSSISGTRWESEKPGVLKLEFFKDNTYTYKLAGLVDFYGRWVALDDGRIKMEWKEKEATYVDFAKIEGDKLRLDTVMMGMGTIYLVKAK